MKLIAKQPCSFGGKRFYIGDEIPVDLVKEPKTQEKYGKLAIVNDDPVADQPAGTCDVMTVFVRAEEGDLPLELNQESLQAVLDILSGNADDAEPIIKQMTNVDALIFLDIADSRKTVKAAAKARAQALNAEQEDEEESAGDQ